MMNVDKEISWLEQRLADVKNSPFPGDSPRNRSSELKTIGRLIEILIKVKHQGIRRAKRQKPEYMMYKEFLAVYAEFIRQRQGVGVLIDSFQGASLKKIIAYLVDNAKDKTESGALEAWKYIFHNWKDVAPFLQQQVALYQIYKNLTEILDNLRNGHYKKQQTGYKKSLADLKSDL